MNCDIPGETLTLKVSCEHWPNDVCSIQFYICRQQKDIKKIIEKRISITTAILQYFSHKVLVLELQYLLLLLPTTLTITFINCIKMQKLLYGIWWPPWSAYLTESASTVTH